MECSSDPRLPFDRIALCNTSLSRRRMMNERPITAATVSPLMVRLDAESEQALAARLACSTIGGVKNSGRVSPRRDFASPAKKKQTERLAKPQIFHRAIRNHPIEKPRRRVAKCYRLMARSICALADWGAVCVFEINFMTRRRSCSQSMPLNRSPILASVTA